MSASNPEVGGENALGNIGRREHESGSSNPSPLSFYSQTHTAPSFQNTISFTSQTIRRDPARRRPRRACAAVVSAREVMRRPRAMRGLRKRICRSGDVIQGSEMCVRNIRMTIFRFSGAERSSCCFPRLASSNSCGSVAHPSGRLANEVQVLQDPGSRDGIISCSYECIAFGVVPYIMALW